MIHARTRHVFVATLNSCSLLKLNKSKSLHILPEAYHFDHLEDYPNPPGNREIPGNGSQSFSFIPCLCPRGGLNTLLNIVSFELRPFYDLLKWRDLRRKLGLIHSLFSSIFHQ